eukprot:5936318-Pleurochrysis_carterae.AAC.3
MLTPIPPLQPRHRDAGDAVNSSPHRATVHPACAPLFAADPITFGPRIRGKALHLCVWPPVLCALGLRPSLPLSAL